MLEELFQSIAGIFKLARGKVSCAHLTPDFVLRMGAIAGNHLFKILNGFGQPLNAASIIHHENVSPAVPSPSSYRPSVQETPTENYDQD